MLGGEVVKELEGCWVLNGLQQVCREAVRLWVDLVARVELKVGGEGEEDGNGEEETGRWGRRRLSALEAARSCCDLAGGMTGTHQRP